MKQSLIKNELQAPDYSFFYNFFDRIKYVNHNREVPFIGKKPIFNNKIIYVHEKL